MTTTAELTNEERNLLKYIHAKLGNRAKGLIREAWETGIYDHRLCSQQNDEATLQRLRNTLGPSWLNRVSLGKL